MAIHRASNRSHEWRVIFKNGNSNVRRKNVALGCWRRCKNFVEGTMLEAPWPYLVLLISSCLILSWILFTLLWWLLIATGEFKDLDSHRPLVEDIKTNACVKNLNNIVDIFLYSLETQQSIGYGVRVAHNSECRLAIMLLCIQGFYAFLSSAFLAEMLFKKMTSGRLRSASLLFSRNAVICSRPHGLSLMFRVGDQRSSYVMTPRLKTLLLRIDRKGDFIRQHFAQMTIGYDEVGADLFLVWPVVLEHKIDQKSPLYGISPAELKSDRFEIVISLQGVVAATGLAMRARTSYTNDEIIWGQSFVPIVSFNVGKKCFDADFAKFHHTYEVDTPTTAPKGKVKKNQQRESASSYNDVEDSEGENG